MHPLLLLLLAHAFQQMQQQQQTSKSTGRPSPGNVTKPSARPSSQGVHGIGQGHRGNTGPIHAQFQGATKPAQPNGLVQLLGSKQPARVSNGAPLH